MINLRAILIILLVLGSAIPVCGQTAQSAAQNSASQGDQSPAPAGPLSRWLELKTGTLGFRYKRAATSDCPWVYQVQYQFQTRGRLKFDREGRYSAGFRLSTGNVFSFSWNSTGAGAGDPSMRVYLKELYFLAAPWKSLEIQFGGIGINRGESTEITSYSNNGYLVGERIIIRRPDKLFFDEISATGAYLGDQESPEVMGRFHRLSSMNYHQFLVAKRISRRFSFSADYTFQDGTETLRQGFKVYPPRVPFLDYVLFENYQRLDSLPAWGWALSIQKNLSQHLSLTGGFVDIDQDYPNWNADRLGKGKRVFIAANYNFWREFSAIVFAGKAFANDFPVINAARFDLILSYDFLRALQRANLMPAGN
jgi:hypothetical protein